MVCPHRQVQRGSHGHIVTSSRSSWLLPRAASSLEEPPLAMQSEAHTLQTDSTVVAGMWGAMDTCRSCQGHRIRLANV